MKLTILALSVLAITACDSGSKSSLCKYDQDNYYYLKDTKGENSRETGQAKLDLLECMSRRLHSQARSLK